MRKLFLILLCLIPLAISAKDYTAQEISLNQADMTIRDLNGRLINGSVNRFYKNGSLMDSVPFKDGRVEGTTKVYYETGELKNETTYKDGQRQGIIKEFYENGKTKSEFPFKDDLEHGIYKLYHPNEKLARSLPFVNGMMEGIERFYNENGSQWLEIRYVANIITNGNCMTNGRRTKLTDQQLVDWNLGVMPVCK